MITVLSIKRKDAEVLRVQCNIGCEEVEFDARVETLANSGIRTVGFGADRDLSIKIQYTDGSAALVNLLGKYGEGPEPEYPIVLEDGWSKGQKRHWKSSGE